MHELALFAGSVAAAIFMLSQLPMLAKACRTRNLTSYSFANIGLANLGNLLYAVYVVPRTARARVGHPWLQLDHVRTDALLVPAPWPPHSGQPHAAPL